MLFGKRERRIGRILIVEDEPLVAFDNESMLKDAGYECPMAINISANESWQLMEQFSALHNQPVATKNNGFGGADVSAADCLDHSGEIDAEWLLPARTEHQAKHERLSAHHVPVEHVHPRGVHSDENFVVGRRRLFDILDAENVRRAKIPIHNGFHHRIGS